MSHNEDPGRAKKKKNFRGNELNDFINGAYKQQNLMSPVISNQ